MTLTRQSSILGRGVITFPVPCSGTIFQACTPLCPDTPGSIDRNIYVWKSSTLMTIEYDLTARFSQHSINNVDININLYCSMIHILMRTVYLEKNGEQLRFLYKIKSYKSHGAHRV